MSEVNRYYCGAGFGCRNRVPSKSSWCAECHALIPYSPSPGLRLVEPELSAEIERLAALAAARLPLYPRRRARA